ncbi:hypothetical protein LK09_15710 [Microbacterium mangrovi]|uniref:Uncharacterized protein n=1 Tax=Microbacterium mangrovi TaxID=1348253 RepID=A0A0B2A462_9MICO|nr:hypothetical protein [Microbacterium mangrovi]KHK96407.1 hypothetical protein LK09_15710 [Microbacterium mangrovi]
MTRDVPEGDAIAEVVRRLEERFPQLPSSQIAEAVLEAQHHYDNARVRDFVPVFVEREARAALERPILTE